MFDWNHQSNFLFYSRPPFRLPPSSLEQLNISCIDADTSLFSTTLRNLVSNALKFTPNGGTVEFGIQIEDKNPIFYVKDNGIGMSPDILNKLFLTDQKVNRAGTEGEESSGLGLLMCKEFINLHDGKIWAESQENLGTSFYFTLGKNESSAI